MAKGKPGERSCANPSCAAGWNRAYPSGHPRGRDVARAKGPSRPGDTVGGDGGGEGTRMTDVGERLRLLEQHVQRAIELIGTVRAENAVLREERAALQARVD